MTKQWTFGRKIASGFAIASFTLLIIGVAGFVSARRTSEDNRWVTHTLQVRTSLYKLLSLYEGAETSQRAYLITGSEELLDPYRAMMAETDKSLGELATLTGDNPHQQQRIAVLRATMATKQAFLKQGIIERKEKGFEAAARIVASIEARVAMDKLRAAIGEMDAEEGHLLEKRTKSAEDSAATAQLIILGGGLAGVVITILCGVWIARSLSRQIGLAVQQMQSSSAELQSAANQQAAGSREQATAMSEISTTVNELLATSRQIAESARRVSEIAEQATTGARAGGLTVEQGQEAMTSMRKQVDLIVNHMLELGRKSQQIGGVLDIVLELAEQTNILAINATIEATVAGDVGKRFAVVADEIRKLADRVGTSTKEIRGLIDDVRAAVSTTVMTTETGSKSVEAGTRQFTDVQTAFRQIATQVLTTMDAAREIGLSIKQQTTAVEQVNIAIGSVAQAAKESQVSSNQTLQTASQLTTLSGDLLRLVKPQNGGSSRANA